MVAFQKDSGIIKSIVVGYKWFHSFHKGISPKVNMIEQLEFELI